MPKGKIPSRLKSLYNKTKPDNFNNTLFGILEQFFKEKDTEFSYITTVQNRLYGTGKLANGKKLRPYAPMTVLIKKRQMARKCELYSSWDNVTSHVTLNDYNYFYSSWKMIVNKYEMKIWGDFWKEPGQCSPVSSRSHHIGDNYKDNYNRQDFETAVLGMTDYEMWAFLTIELKPILIKKILHEILTK